MNDFADPVIGVRDIVEYNKTLHNVDEESVKKGGSPVYSNECSKKILIKKML